MKEIVNFLTQRLNQYKNDFIRFLRSTDFSKAIVLTIAIVVPIGIFSNLGILEVGISLAMGCLLSSPSDVPGSFKHKLFGIFIAAILGSLSYLIAGYLGRGIWTSIPMLLIMMFSVSFLSVYGFRASLVSFAGLLAVVLSFANISTGIEIWQKSLLIGAGGIWYLAISTAWYFLRPQRASEQLLAETMELTAIYLRIRSRLLKGETKKELQKELLERQVELNEHHESLREILISARESSGNSGYTRKRLLVFIDLVDMLELAMANPIDHNKMRALLDENREELSAFVNFSQSLASHLEKIGFALLRNHELPENTIQKELKKVRSSLKNFRNKVDVSLNREALILMRNLYDYQVRQAQKLTNIDRVLKNLETNKKLVYKTKEVKKFITQQDYSLRTLLTNLNTDSVIFRHSIRLAIMVAVGYLIGSIFSVQNAYWILLTIVVIMRPNYGLTKIRTKKRIIGTLIGGAIAIGIVLLTQNSSLYAVLGLLSLTLAFSLIQRNYTTAAIFITLSIIFIYALLKPDVHEVIQYRIVDTLVGAGLAALGNFILWPKWEYESLNQVITASIRANRQFLNEIDWYYHKKEKLPVSYKLVRKKAFLEMGNLSGAFQRMTQEPKSRQKKLGLVYEIVELNQTFLSALASMGTYIRTHPTTKASSDFEAYSNTISYTLENCVNLLEGKFLRQTKDTEILEASKSLQRKFDKLALARDEEIESGKLRIDRETRHLLQEAHLITGQLEWLLDISNKLLEKVKKLTEKNEQAGV